MPKRVNETPLTVKLKSGAILSPEQARFCLEYIQNMGNGMAAAVEAYNIDKNKKGWYSTATSMANENLIKPDILEYIRELWDDQGLNDEIVDVETSFLVKQRADNGAKAKGIDIYNKIGGRYSKDNEQKQQILPQPIINVYRDNSDRKDNGPDTKGEGNTGGNVGKQDDQHPNILNRISTKR
jgi:hypothetical protein